MYQPNFKEMDELVEQGYLKKQISPCCKLILYDYTDKTTYERYWNEHTINNRGMVYELSTGKVVARPFPKFFNWSELDKKEQQRLLSLNSFTATSKEDGSLGIIYFYDGEWRVNTRGSFNSDQAIKAKSMLKNMMKHAYKSLTYLVEIIYPENRVVVDYGSFEGLIQIGTYETSTGREIYTSGSPFDDSASIAYFNNIEELQSYIKTLTYNEEGYVVRFSDGTRVKFKGDEYLKMHRIVTRLSPLVLWENMKDGEVDKSFLMSIPEEFRKEYEEIAHLLKVKYNNELDHIYQSYLELSCRLNLNTAKELGIFLKNNPSDYSSAYFELLKGRPIPDKLIMKIIRPKNNQIM